MLPSGATITSEGALNWFGAVAGHAGLTERHQHLAVLVELYGRIALLVLAAPVGDPDVVVLVDIEAMREIEHPGAEARHDMTAGIVFGERRDIRSFAVVAAATIENPHALAVAIDIQADSGPKTTPHGLLRPALIEPVRIGRGIGVRC